MFKTGSPWLREIFEEAKLEGKLEGERKATATAVATVLVAPFGADAEVVMAQLKPLSDARLKKLVEHAATCPDLDSFRKEIAPRRRARRT